MTGGVLWVHSPEGFTLLRGGLTCMTVIIRTAIVTGMTRLPD